MEHSQKSILRKEILTLLRNQKEEDRLSKSGIIKNKLFALPEFQQASTILFYASFDGEVDTFEMMREAIKLNKKVTLPSVIKEDKKIVPRQFEDLEKGVEPGPYGILQPKIDASQELDFTELDLVIVPGVAFDKKNNRLGRGEGYYDRFLNNVPPNVSTVGLAFDFQIVENLPANQTHDIPVSRVITN